VFQLVKETVFMKTGARAESKEILSWLLLSLVVMLVPLWFWETQRPSTACFKAAPARQC